MVAWLRRGRLPAIAALIIALTLGDTAMAADAENTLYMDIPFGRVVIAMRPDLAPRHVEQIKALTRRGFYDGVPFHRVIDGFMVQGGDPTGTGTGGSGNKLRAEFSSEKHVRGVLSMARASDPDSADSQFFIMLGSAPSLDGQYTVWGKVESGMEYVDKIKKGDQARNGVVSNPDKIIKMQVAADADKAGGKAK
jgi:peptidylprolyl isomerase